MDNQFSHVRIVMIGTSHAGNIGAAARAMKVMGLSRLYLVAPRCRMNEDTLAMSASAFDVIDGIKIVDRLEDALEGCVSAYGASARVRGMDWPMLPPRAAAERMAVEVQQGDVAWVFGREDSGLSNDELRQCQTHVHIPTNPNYSSLNVAAAVQVLCYETRVALLGDAVPAPKKVAQGSEKATIEAMEHFYTHLEEAMVDIEFHDPAAPKQTMTRLRRLFNRVELETMELSILRGVLTGIQRFARLAKTKK